MKKTIQFLKEHWIFLIIILVLGLFQVKDLVSLEQIPYVDPVSGYYPRAEILRQSIFEYGDLFPIWEPYLMSGMPYLDASAPIIFSYQGLFLLILNDSIKTIQLAFIFSIILTGISMYILAYWLIENKRAALISAIVYMLSGFMLMKLNEGALNQLMASTLLPVIMLFVIKAFKKDLVKNTLIAGILTSLQIYTAPDLKATLFTGLIVSCYLVIELIGKDLAGRLKKTIFVGITLLVIIFGLTSLVILPTKETIGAGSRAQLSFEESASRLTPISELFSSMVEGGILEYHYDPTKAPRRVDKYKIGIVAFLLGLFAVWKLPKNRIIWFLVLTTIITLLFVTGSWFYYLLWKYVPPWHSFRYLERGYIMWSFSGALLAGLGMKELLKTLKNKSKLLINSIFVLIVVGIIISLAIFIPKSYEDYLCKFSELLEKNEGMRYLSELREKEIFRIHDIETIGIDWGTESYTVPYKLEHIFGYTGNWDPQYMNIYLSIAYKNPSKFWGILNVKYITSRSKINDSNFILIKEFPDIKKESDFCPPDPHLKSFPNYVYENKATMPRAWMTDKAIAIIGSKDHVTQATYSIMLSNFFDPKKVVLIWKEGKVEDYSSEELSQYDGIILLPSSVTANSQSTLFEYKKNGGKLFPDILEGEQQIEEANLVALMNGSYVRVEDSKIKTISFEKKTIDVPKAGWLVLSERYSAYPSWTAEQNGKEIKIERADGVISAVYLDNDGEVNFYYLPQSFVIGLFVSAITFIICLGFIIYKRKAIFG